MSETIRGRLKYLEQRVFDLKKEIEQEFDEDIIPNLLTLIRELQEKLPDESYDERSHILYFSRNNLAYLLTKNGFKNLRKTPSQTEDVKTVVHHYLNSDEHKPSIKAAKSLLDKIISISEHYGVQLTREYTK